MAGFLLELVGNDENLCRYRVLQQEDHMEGWDPRDLRHHQA
jgi:hypothetical protein